MNVWQRIVLVVGAVAVLVAFPWIKSYESGNFYYEWKGTLGREAAVVISTAALYFATSKRK